MRQVNVGSVCAFHERLTWICGYVGGADPTRYGLQQLRLYVLDRVTAKMQGETLLLAGPCQGGLADLIADGDATEIASTP